MAQAASENPAAKIGQMSGQDAYASPMYSPLQHHNPKRKMNDLATKQIRADHNLSRPLAEDHSGMQLMSIPKV